MLRLRRLKNNEFELAETLAAKTSVPLDVCPTCGSQLIDGEWEGQQSYIYNSDTFECDCQTQYTLRMHYLIASIPAQYHTLDFPTDYKQSSIVRQAIWNYLEHWEKASRMGLGLLFRSKGLGTGKTFAATYVAKVLIKNKQKVLFTPFREMIAEMDGERFKEVTFLIIDEVQAGWSERQSGLFSDRFEQIIRHRNHHALPTIITTNLTAGEFDSEYPRIASLLVPSTVEIDMPGGDYRNNDYAMQRLALLANNEVRPIT